MALGYIESTTANKYLNGPNNALLNLFNGKINIVHYALYKETQCNCH